MRDLWVSWAERRHWQQVDERVRHGGAMDDVGALHAKLDALHVKVDALATRQPRMRRHGWLRHLIKGLENDPRMQARVHLVACWYWLINFPIIGLLFFGFPHLWVYVGLLLNTFYSLYANLATDYDGLSSSQASLHARDATEAATEAARSRGTQD